MPLNMVVPPTRPCCSVSAAIALAVLAFHCQFLSVMPLEAQLTRGVVSGVLNDPSGAVIPHARVRITNLATNQSRSTETNFQGVYEFSAVEPGSYDVEFAASGFADKKILSVRVGPADEVVLNTELAIRGVSTSIEVVPVPSLAKATPTVERTLDQSVIELMPLTAATRDVTTLAMWAPGTVRAPGIDGSFSDFSTEGQRSRNNNFLIDGTDNNDLEVTGPEARLIPEAVSEFQVQSNAYSAEFGRNTGAQVSAVTKRGSNALHGQLWEYYRANWMNPLNLLNKRAGFLRTPPFVQNQFGGSLGGPLRKDRTFFFGALDVNLYREAPNATNATAATIPTASGFAALSSLSLGAGESAAGRRAALNALSFLPQAYRGIGQYQSLRTQTINGQPIQVGTVRVPLARPYDFWYGLLRIDHRLSDADNLTFRLQEDKRTQPNSAGNLEFGDLFTAASNTLNQNFALSSTHSWSSNWLNEFRFAFARSNLSYPENDPLGSTVNILGAFTIGGLSTFPQGRITNIFQWENTTTYALGKHELKFGADISRNRLFNLAASYSKGTWAFNSLADFMNNQPYYLLQSVNTATYDARQTTQCYFIQDNFKLTPNLTINAGLRYQYSGVPFGFFGAASPEIAAAGVPLPAKPDNNDWAPRLGFAFAPNPAAGWKRRLFGNQQTVFRGGFGIAYDVVFYNILTETANNYPRVVEDYDLSPAQNLFPILAPKQTSILPFSPLDAFVNTPTDIHNPTTDFWSFSIQRQFGTAYLLEIGYMGNVGYHLLRQGQANPGQLTAAQAAQVIGQVSDPTIPNIPSLQDRLVNPAWGSRATIESDGRSAYDGIFVRVDRNMAKGLYFGVNYTWSGTFSNSDEPLGIGAIALSSPQLPQSVFNLQNEWSRSAFDFPQRFSFLYVYSIPTAHVLRANSVANQVLSGWQISGRSEWQSGQPFTIQTGVDSGGSGIPIGWRPDYNPAGILLPDPTTGNLRTFTNLGVFVTPLTAGGLPLANSMPTGGNLGRNTLRGPGFVNWDISLSKTFQFSEHVGLKIRNDWFNALNHRNFGNPVATMNSAAFGTNTTDPGSRSMLLNATLSF